MTSKTATLLEAERVDRSLSNPASTGTQLWRVPIFVGLFHNSRELIVAAPTRYHAACAADQIITGDEWFPSFSAEPITNDDILQILMKGSDPQ